MKNQFLRRLTVMLTAALLGGACIAENALAGSTPRVVYVTPTGQTPRSDSPSSEETAAQETTPTPTVTSVTMTAGQDLSCVTGPDWKLYEWVTRIPEGETVTLIARAVPEIPDYYVARTGGGQECWAFGGSSIISGPVDSLPVRETPPLPEIPFLVRNQVYIDLADVYIRPAGEASWGADRLTSAAIPIAGEAAISITAGYYDMRIIDARSNVMLELYNRPIGADDAYRILEVAVDVEFSLRNNAELLGSVCKIDVRPQGGSWQKLYDADDGGGCIPYLQSRTFTLRAGLYDARGTFWDDDVHLDNLYVRPGDTTYTIF